MSLLALDTDVLVAWAHAGALRHLESRRLVEREIGERGGRLALTPQVVFEFVHVVTDRRRFEEPLAMQEAGDLAGQLWRSPQVERIPASPRVVPRTLELLRIHGLGRKRILDTALAATLELAGVARLATWNAGDFASFDFLEVVTR